MSGNLWSVSNQIRGEVNRFFSCRIPGEGSVPPLVYKAVQQLFVGSHSPGHTGVWKLYGALQTVCSGTPKPHPEPSSPSATVSAESSVPEWHEGHAWLPGFSVAGLFLLMLKKHQAASQYDALRKTTHTLSCLLSPTEKLGFRDTGMSFLAAAVRGALSSCLCQCARPYRLSPCSVSSAGCFWDTRCTVMAHFPNS